MQTAMAKKTLSETLVKQPQSTASNNAARDRGRFILLMHNLETALAAPSYERAEDWNDFVQEELAVLRTALTQSRQDMNAQDGLFAEIAADNPRLIHRIEKLKQEFVDLERQIETLVDQFKKSNHAPDVTDIRERLSWLLKAIRHAQAKENELVFEAVGQDLGAGG